MKHIPLIEYAAWEPLLPEERDALVGRSFRFETRTRCEIMCNGLVVSRTQFSEAEIEKATRHMEFLKAAFLKEPELAAIRKYCPDANVEPVFSVEIRRWWPRYSETASGAWLVVSELIGRGWRFDLQSFNPEGWECSAWHPFREERCTTAEATMPEAVCKVAVSIALHTKAKEEL